MVQGTMASVRKKSWSTMRSKGTTSNIFSEQTDSEEARTYEEAWLMVSRHALMFCLYDKSMIADCICPSPHSDAYRHNKDQHPWGGASAARISNPPNEIAHGAKQKLNRDCIRKWMLAWSGSWKNGGTEEWISPSRWTAIQQLPMASLEDVSVIGAPWWVQQPCWPIDEK